MTELQELEFVPTETHPNKTIDDIELAHDMAIAMDPYEEQRIKWQPLLDKYIDEPNGIYGSRGYLKKEIKELAGALMAANVEELRDLPLGDRTSYGPLKDLPSAEEVNNDESEWLKQAIWTGRDRYPKGKIFNSFVLLGANELVSLNKGKSFRAAEAVYFKAQANKNIELLEEVLTDDDKEVFAPIESEDSNDQNTQRPKYRFISSYFRGFEDLGEITELDIKRSELMSIYNRKKAYESFAKLFNFDQITDASLANRKDVLAFSELMENAGFLFETKN